MDPTDTLSEALHVLAGDVCLHVSKDCIAMCRPFSVPGSGEKIESSFLSTWLCEGAHFFTLFRPSAVFGTLLFSHTNEVLYHASMDAQLSAGCPADVCFLCQFTTDCAPEGSVPRLLVFDVLFNQPQSVRGDTLRSLQKHLPQPLATVQWIGPRQYLSREFIAGLPHKIRGLIALGSDPLMAGTLELNE